MDWIVTIRDSWLNSPGWLAKFATESGFAWLNTLGWLAGLAVAFGILARLMPCNPGMYWWKDLRAVGTDVMYWFVVPLFLRIGRTADADRGAGAAVWRQGTAVLAGKEPAAVAAMRWRSC